MSIETPDYAKMLERLIRAYVRRVADADEVDLVDMLRVKQTMDQAFRDAVRAQHDAGRSWGEIARALGTTRQSAHATYGRETTRRDDVATVA